MRCSRPAARTAGFQWSRRQLCSDRCPPRSPGNRSGVSRRGGSSASASAALSGRGAVLRESASACRTASPPRPCGRRRGARARSTPPVASRSGLRRARRHGCLPRARHRREKLSLSPRNRMVSGKRFESRASKRSDARSRPEELAICGISTAPFAPIPQALPGACTMDLSSEKTILDARRLNGRCASLLFVAKGLS